MIRILKTEFIKERRSANSKLKFFVPIIFVLFNIMMVSLMGISPSGKSYIMATSFNWYPILILPIVISLLVINVINKEKDEHIGFQRSMNIRAEKILLSKNIVVILELLTILFISSIAIYFVGILLLNEKIYIDQLIVATCVLFLGSLPIIAISFLINNLINKKFLVILINFVLTFPSAIIAVTSKWMFFPWAYNLRILSPIIGVHPNGTFLETNSYLMNMSTTYFGIFLCLAVYFFITLLSLFIVRRNNRV